MAMAHSTHLASPKTAFSIEGHYIDIAHYLDGRSHVIQQGQNIVTEQGLNLVAGLIGGIDSALPITQWVMGDGSPDWDSANPAPDPYKTISDIPVPRSVASVKISYWNTITGTFSEVPTSTIDVRALFNADEAIGTFRQFGLVSVTDDPEIDLTGPIPPDKLGSVTLFNHVAHGPIVKSNEFNLERILRITVKRV